jgi:hypothetical protein
MYLNSAQDDHPTTRESKTKTKNDNFYRIRGNSNDCDICVDVSIRKAQNFSDLYEKVISDSPSLTQFSKRDRKWQSKQYDNATMIKITTVIYQNFRDCLTSLNHYSRRDCYGVTSYKLSAMGSVTQLKPRELQVHSDNSRLDILGFYYINVNLESQTATKSFVIVTLYDKEGKVISPGRAQTEQVNITTHSLEPFGIAVTEKIGDKIKD